MPIIILMLFQSMYILCNQSKGTFESIYLNNMNGSSRQKLFQNIHFYLPRTIDHIEHVDAGKLIAKTTIEYTLQNM
jgi:hypothetical protein